MVGVYHYNSQKTKHNHPEIENDIEVVDMELMEIWSTQYVFLFSKAIYWKFAEIKMLRFISPSDKDLNILL